MKLEVKKRSSNRLRAGLLIVFVFAGSSASWARGDGEYTMDRVVLQKSYELHYLGCKPRHDSLAPGHLGIFLFIWKGDKPTQVYGNRTPDGKGFYPSPEFVLHHDFGWKFTGSGCGTGVEWIPVQPGQVITFSMGLDWIEREVPGSSAVKSADRARLLMDTKEGQVTSDDIILPLVPLKSK